MRFRRSLTIAAGAAVAVLALAGCTTGSEPTAEPADAGAASGTVDKILFDYPFTALPVYSALVSSVSAYAEEQGVEVVFTNDNMDLATQVSQLTSYLSSDVDAVVSFPMDNASLESIAKQYMDSGKYWVTYGGDMENQTTSLQFSFTESGRTLGENAAEWADEVLGGTGKVLLLGDETIQLGQERTAGIVEALEELAPGLEIITQQAITPEEGLSVTTSVLSQHPDVSIVLAAAGDAAAGAYQALISSGRAADDPKTYVGGLDGNLTLFQEMKAGNIVRGVVTINSMELAEAIVDVPRGLASGTPESVYNIPVYLVTPESIDIDEYITAFGG